MEEHKFMTLIDKDSRRCCACDVLIIDSIEYGFTVLGAFESDTVCQRCFTSGTYKEKRQIAVRQLVEDAIVAGFTFTASRTAFNSGFFYAANVRTAPRVGAALPPKTDHRHYYGCD